MTTPPRRGDVVWISFDPQIGREQAGTRPALVLSANAYNKSVGLMIVCPITNQAKGYPFEVPIPAGLKVSGVVLADHVKSVDWQDRGCSFICQLPVSVVQEVIAKVQTLLSGQG
jgi:mRNA interferase MazF